MSQGQGQGPPDDAGPPEHVREKFSRAKRANNGTIDISDDTLEQLTQNVDWDNLSPFEEWVLALLNENGLLDE